MGAGSPRSPRRTVSELRSAHRTFLGSSLLATVSVVSVAAGAGAQEGAITGTVLDAGSLQPVTGAHVFIPGTAIGTLSSPTGTYRLEGVPAGTPMVSVQLIGYREASDTVEVAAGQLAQADFALEQTALRLQDIIVTGLVAETPRVKLAAESPAGATAGAGSEPRHQPCSSAWATVVVLGMANRNQPMTL